MRKPKDGAWRQRHGLAAKPSASGVRAVRRWPCV